MHTCTGTSPTHMHLPLYRAQRHLTHALRGQSRSNSCRSARMNVSPYTATPHAHTHAKVTSSSHPYVPKPACVHFLTVARFGHTCEHTPMTTDSCTEVTDLHTLRSHYAHMYIIYRHTVHTHTYKCTYTCTHMHTCTPSAQITTGKK